MPANSLRRNRLSIPKVDPNPQPPNHVGRPRSMATGSMIDRMAEAVSPALQANPTTQTSANPIKGGPVYDPVSPTTSAQSGLSTATAGAIETATNALGLSSYSPTQGQPDPRDAEYWRNLNNLLFNTQGKIRNLNLAGTRAELDRGRETADLNTSRSRDQRSLGESAISQGLANSGWLARNETQDATDYLRNYEDLQTGYDRSAADRRTDVSQAIQDYISGEGDQMGTALSRWLDAQSKTAQTGNPENKPSDLGPRVLDPTTVPTGPTYTPPAPTYTPPKPPKKHHRGNR